MIFFGILGLLIITFAVWEKREKWQDVLFVLGGACLLAYSLWIRDVVFILLQIIFILSALVEYVKLRKKK